MGFLAHTAEMANHFRQIWKHLPTGSFDIVNAGVDAHTAEVDAIARAEGIPCVTANALVQAGVMYDVLVSNHPVDFRPPIPLIKRIGRINVRLMYNVAKSGWNLQPWNEWYDVVLCFGPYHRETMSKVTGATMVEVGYPRFDHFFDLLPRRAELLAAMGGDPAKRTIVWLPTWQHLTSIGWFDAAIGQLAQRYNVIVKPHPLLTHQEPAKIAALQALGLLKVVTDSSDNVPLFAVADFVLADYGGSALAAVYTDRNLLLLDVPNAEQDELLGDGSPDLLIREWIPHVSPVEAGSLSSLLDDADVWEQQRAVRRELRSVFFASHFGYSGRVAAEALMHAKLLAAQGTTGAA